jgi:hypothetical protein
MCCGAIGEDVPVVMTERGRGGSWIRGSAGGWRWAVAAVVVAVIAAAVLLLTPRTNQAVRPVDYAGELATARAVAPYTVAVPVGLDPGWTPASVKFTRHHGASRWHLGLITPGGDTVGLEQSDGNRSEFVDLQTGRGRPDGVIEVNSEAWSKRYSASRNLRSLILERADSVIIVAGITDYATLAELAQTLDVS